MRPVQGEDAFGRQRSAGYEAAPSVSMPSSSSHHMSFFLADEATVDSYLDQPSLLAPRARDPRKPAETGHVLSLHARDEQDTTERARAASRQLEREGGAAVAYSPLSGASLPSPASVPMSHISRPMTPITLGTSCAGSVASSPLSRRNSLVGSLFESAVISDEEDDDTPRLDESMMDGGSAPQLVMPSIRMPSRRPFTETGKSLGRLKVLIAGRVGVGKTALIKAIVQTCEHIVYVDPIVPPDAPRRSSRAARPSISRRSNSNHTERISEILASTKSYPEWWTELDEFRVSQRRKSLGDQVLDRNICFVDTPGYGTGPSVSPFQDAELARLTYNPSQAMESIVTCVDYVESHLNKVSSDSLSEPEMLNMLGGNGGFQVDLVLYLVHRSLCPVDVEYLKRLAPLTNIIPLLAQADTLTPREQAASKQQILSQLREAGIRPFDFTGQASDLATASIPYAVSSTTGSDHDVMDASLLMSPDYVQPLVSSELALLIERIFSGDGSSWLRHSAAKKYMQWRSSPNVSRPKHLYRLLSLQGPPVPTMGLDQGTGALIRTLPQELARFHGQHYDSARPVQFHVVDWAAELQRSLVSERARHEAALRESQAARLTGQLINECAIRDGTLVSVHNRSKCTRAERRRRNRGRRGSVRTSLDQDPLGLLELAANLKARGWVFVEVLGGLGILGGIAYWLSRQRWQAEPVQLADEWARMWGLDI
jgi:hypothetical protein